MNIAFRPSDDGFLFGDHYIRIVRNFTTEAGTTEDVGFVATDLARALEHSQALRITRLLDPDQKGNHSVATPGGTQSLTVISESGFYRVVLRSDKPQAEPLQQVVSREILPTLRKTGSYQVQPAPQPPAVAGQNTDIAATYFLVADRLGALGVKPGIATAAALSSIQKGTGLVMDEMMRSLPPIDTDVPSLTPTALGKTIGISARAVNKKLAKAGLQWWTKKQEWQLTEAGQKYGAAFPYSRNNHTGFQIRWVPDVVDLISDQPALS